MPKKIHKAVIPAAGYGTRFLPATKAQPKEMLPLVDKPIIQYVVEDAVSAGIEDIIIVTGWTKRSIEDHFDYPFELEKRLEEAGKYQELESVRKIADLANFYYLRQKGPLGNATPILNAKQLIGNEPFLVLWGDDFIEAVPTRSKQLVQAYQQLGGSAILGSIKTTKEQDYEHYGFALGKEIERGLIRVSEIIEKPGRKIDSDYAIVSGSLFGPEIFEAIEEVMAKRRGENEKAGHSGNNGKNNFCTQMRKQKELVYTEALNVLLGQQKAVYALEIKNGKYYDCGNKLEYLKAVVEFGLKHEDLREEFGKFLKELKV